MSVLIDYVAEIVGLKSKAIAQSAVTIEFQGQRLRVLHPIQLMQSKIWNLYRLKDKQTAEGVEQARLAIEVAAAVVEASGLGKRDLLKAVESIGKFSATTPARHVRDNYRLDCLKAVPASVFKKGVLPAAFHEKRWPQILAAAK